MKELALITLLASCVMCFDPRLLEVPTVNGPVLGSEEVSRSGRSYYSFRGIPFAKPPVGELRWQNPEPPDNWTETWNATERGPYCIQRDYLFHVNPPVEGQEDCLYVSVYTPQINPDDLLPVVVSIPYGGFYMGRGTSDLYGADFFMDKDVILVSANYRLGPFGFLSTLDDNAPGNFGLKDQALALKWVQENIRNFGGNRKAVTIMGQSAGAMSVHYHLLSPLSKGLFHRAISQSASALTFFAKMFNKYVPSIISKQASLVNCSDFQENNAALMKCMKNVSAHDFLQTQDAFKEFSLFPYSVYWPVAERATEANPEPFLTKQPLEYITAGEFTKVPWIIGCVTGEGQISAEGILRRSDTRKTLEENFDILPNHILSLSMSTDNTSDISRKINEFYLGGDNFVNISDPTKIQRFVDVVTDRWFIYSSYQTVMLHSAMGHTPIWFYMFNYKGAYTYGDYFSATNETIDHEWGVSHCDELLYLFKSPLLFPKLKSFDNEVSKLMVNMWTNFIIRGDPTPTLKDYANSITWSPVNISGKSEMQNDNLCFLSVEGSFKQQHVYLQNNCGLYKQRMEFWAHQNLSDNFQGLDNYKIP